jgi:hypothetical protein
MSFRLVTTSLLMTRPASGIDNQAVYPTSKRSPAKCFRNMCHQSMKAVSFFTATAT